MSQDCVHGENYSPTYVWGIGVSPLDREVIEEVSRSQVGAGLRDELGSLHLRIPGRGSIDGEFQTPLLRGVGGILVGGVQSQVTRRRLAAVNVLYYLM